MDNNNFQDKIDEFLLHGDTMPEEEKAQFLKEIEEDKEKKEQYEFTKNVQRALVSRGEKLKAMKMFQQEYERQRLRPVVNYAPAPADVFTGNIRPKKNGQRKVWLWISSIAAVFVAGFFAINLLFVDKTPSGNMRGNKNDVFEMTIPADSTENDSASVDSL